MHEKKKLKIKKAKEHDRNRTFTRFSHTIQEQKLQLGRGLASKRASQMPQDSGVSQSEGPRGNEAENGFLAWRRNSPSDHSTLLSSLSPMYVPNAAWDCRSYSKRRARLEYCNGPSTDQGSATVLFLSLERLELQIKKIFGFMAEVHDDQWNRHYRAYCRPK